MSIINTLIFDFGDVFINLDKQGAMKTALQLFKIDTFEADMVETNTKFEVGAITSSEFIDFYLSKFPNLNRHQIVHTWNSIIKDFPRYRLNFIRTLVNKGDYKLILLSNTNDLHIDFIKSNVSFYDEFKSCFDAFYLSQEINLRKPNADIFQFVLDENHLNPNQCLFIDDTKENTDTAASMGFHTWNIDETKEDVIDLFKIKKEHF